ncbi:Sec-independent protein translocase subunit TatA [Mycolicibacterium komossense]|uniref:Sec-independent protein translocase protein TatA n=1 Tax=Mycolicibacterium komossense TaxID=1779 RepID=A0ABT3C6X3_9MYCO|nr:Sec-independent protein translocase subunit TatA [Mycolicibacterium komossense]MCV7225224.1 Sec-independent protein translocase subunit TatA [Mycolicibacterium komossense]
MGGLSPWHWAILAVVIILLFGAKRLPDAARSLGKSMRIFKSEVKEMQNDGKAEPSPAPSPAPIQPAVTQVQSERVDTAEPKPTDARPA